MKGLVLSGGAGTRLRPITHTSAKQLVPVANKPVLFYGLEAMRAAGITEVGIVVGDTRAEIEAAVGDGSRFGLAVTYIPQEAPLGLAHAVLIAEAFLGAEPFVMYLGDNLLKEGIAPFVHAFEQSAPDALILLQKVKDPGEYGIAELQDGRGEVVESTVEGPVQIGDGSRLERCTVRGPVVIGAGCRLSDTFIGPYTAISDGVVVEQAEIEHSIVLENSRICRLGARMADSLIGRDCVIAHSEALPVAYRFMVGDSSQIGILGA